ncbi:hypothetical protein DFH09DRAFT_529756 [Mycena vulgaris]|nr:hypothetical protein DFH09DRAFT_529756 [Mycena vulgaris]
MLQTSAGQSQTISTSQANPEGLEITGDYQTIEISRLRIENSQLNIEDMQDELVFCTSSVFYSPTLSSFRPNTGPCLIEFPPTCEVRSSPPVVAPRHGFALLSLMS